MLQICIAQNDHKWDTDNKYIFYETTVVPTEVFLPLS